MKFYPIFLILALIFFSMAGYHYYQYSQPEPTQELVPCYDFHGNVISGAECIETVNLYDVVFSFVVGVILICISIVLFNEEKEKQ